MISISEPLVMLCKHAKLKGECVNITQATGELEEFDNSVGKIVELLLSYQNFCFLFCAVG